MTLVEVAIMRFAHGEDLSLPQYVSEGSAGLDLKAATPAGETILLRPGMRRAIETGIAIALPGFLVHLGYLAVLGDPKAPPDAPAIPEFFAHIYNYAWFASFGVAFTVYIVLMAVAGNRRSSD